MVKFDNDNSYNKELPKDYRDLPSFSKIKPPEKNKLDMSKISKSLKSYKKYKN